MGKINKILGSGTSAAAGANGTCWIGGLESSGFPILTPVAVALTLAL